MVISLGEFFVGADLTERRVADVPDGLIALLFHVVIDEAR